MSETSDFEFTISCDLVANHKRGQVKLLSRYVLRTITTESSETRVLILLEQDRRKRSGIEEIPEIQRKLTRFKGMPAYLNEVMDALERDRLRSRVVVQCKECNQRAELREDLFRKMAQAMKETGESDMKLRNLVGKLST